MKKIGVWLGGTVKGTTKVRWTRVPKTEGMTTSHSEPSTQYLTKPLTRAGSWLTIAAHLESKNEVPQMM